MTENQCIRHVAVVAEKNIMTSCIKTNRTTTFHLNKLMHLDCNQTFIYINWTFMLGQVIENFKLKVFLYCIKQTKYKNYTFFYLLSVACHFTICFLAFVGKLSFSSLRLALPQPAKLWDSEIFAKQKIMAMASCKK